MSSLPVVGDATLAGPDDAALVKAARGNLSAFDAADPATRGIQPGRYRVELGGIALAVHGPWTFSWEVAGR